MINKILSIWNFVSKMMLVAIAEMGFHSFEDIGNQIFFLKYKFLARSIAMGSVLLGVLFSVEFNDFVELYVYAPKAIFYTCISVTFSEWVTGVMKATMKDGEKFDLVKGASIVPKLISQSWALTTSFHFGSNEPIMSWLPIAIAIFLFSYNFLKSCYQITQLQRGWLPDGFAEFLQEKFKLNAPLKDEE
jgi:hypothetical protein